MLKPLEIGQVALYSVCALAVFYGFYSAQSFILSNIFIIGPAALAAVGAAFVAFYIHIRRSESPERRRVR